MDQLFDYRNCVWYMSDVDRCKLPANPERFSKCWCQTNEPDSFCLSINKFLTTSSNWVDIEEEIEEDPSLESNSLADNFVAELLVKALKETEAELEREPAKK